MDASYFHSLLMESKRARDQPKTLIRYKSLYNEPIIQFLYPVRYRGTPTGLLVIDLKEQGFRQLVESYNSFYKGQIAITDPSSVMVYHTDSAKAGKNMYRSLKAYSHQCDQYGIRL